MKLKKNDKVIILHGKDRGKIGSITLAWPKRDEVQVKGIHLVKKHQKKNNQNPVGGIIEKYLPVKASSVQLVCPSCSKPTRIGYLIKDKEKTRICRKCNSSLDISQKDS